MIVIICYRFLSNHGHMIFDILLQQTHPFILYRVFGACDDREPSFIGANEQQ